MNDKIASATQPASPASLPAMCRSGGRIQVGPPRQPPDQRMALLDPETIGGPLPDFPVFGTRLAPLSVGHCCRATRRLVGELFDLACMAAIFRDGSERRPQRHVRQIAMYLCRVVLSLPYVDIGRALGSHPTTVMHACARVEDRRDDPAYDAFVDRCERCVLAVFASAGGGHGEA